jgi:Raf kinase inhibitor-like YbhB/YbcL family protein
MASTAQIETLTLTIGSTAFTHKGSIPSKHTCDGENVNPSLTIENIPPGTKSLTLIIDDPDAPTGVFTHWVLWNIHPMEMILENTVPGTEGKNSFGRTFYQGPCPSDGRVHRYFFKVYALDTLLKLRPGSNKETVENAMMKHLLAEGEIIGLYQRREK